MKKCFYFVLLLSITLLVSCGSDESGTDNTDPKKPSVTGDWQDSVKTGSTSLKVNLQLIQAYSVITGSVQLSLKRIYEGVTETYEFSSSGINGTSTNSNVEAHAGKKGDEFKFAGQVLEDNTKLSGTVTFQISGENKIYSFDMVFEKY
ncbi:MAG: hypothetical protein V1720_20765 [bacterium]